MSCYHSYLEDEKVKEKIKLVAERDYVCQWRWSRNISLKVHDQLRPPFSGERRVGFHL